MALFSPCHFVYSFAVARDLTIGWIGRIAVFGAYSSEDLL